MLLLPAILHVFPPSHPLPLPVSSHVSWPLLLLQLSSVIRSSRRRCGCPCLGAGMQMLYDENSSMGARLCITANQNNPILSPGKVILVL